MLFQKSGFIAALIALASFNPISAGPSPTDGTTGYPVAGRCFSLSFFKKPDIIPVGGSQLDFGSYFLVGVGAKNAGNAYSLPCPIRVRHYNGYEFNLYVHSMYTGETVSYWVIVEKTVRGGGIESFTVDYFDAVNENNECNNTMHL